MFLQCPIRTVLVLAYSIVLFSVAGGCASKVSVNVKPLTSETFSPMPPNTVIDEWKIPPKQPYLELAKLIATSSGDDEETHVRERLMNRARQLGADGIIVVKSDVSEERGNPRYNTASTSEGGGSGGGEGGLPIFGIPWFAEETSSDSIRFTYYLSAIAIKYLPLSSTEKTIPHAPISPKPIPAIKKK